MSFEAAKQEVVPELESARGAFYGNPSRKEIAMFLIGQHKCHTLTTASFVDQLWREMEKKSSKNSK
tara:strand:+ start:477 stop:674 length:198 start_codon:yes stop_codon:yes gene_type:complete